MQGRTVKIYLVDGIPNGVITAEIMNWTGKFIVAPRSQLADLGKRNELKKTGIYILTGQNPEDPTQEMVYIGESDNIWQRLIQHNNDNNKEFWTKTIVIISKDENLTKAHVRYLESRLIQIVVQSQRVKIQNGTNPENITLPESDVADMEYFLEQIQLILPVLGFSFAIPLPQSTLTQLTLKNEETIYSPVFIMTYKRASATAQEINGEFVVFKGSTARKAHTNSLADYYLRLREKLLKEEKLKESNDPNFWVFTQNVPFQSPSTAANIVGGASLNGRKKWKVRDSGITYAQWLKEQIKTAESNDFENR